MRQDTRITVRLDSSMVEQLDAIARQNGVKRSEVIRDALTASLAASTTLGGPGPAASVRTLVRALLAIQGEPEQLRLFEEALDQAGPGGMPRRVPSQGGGRGHPPRPGRTKDWGDVRPGTDTKDA